MKTVLLVQDDDSARIATKWFLSNLGYIVESVGSAGEALALFDARIHDVIVTENAMAGMTGVELAHIIKLRSPSTPVLMYSSVPPEDRSCVDLVLQMPTHLPDLKFSLDGLLTASSPQSAQ